LRIAWALQLSATDTMYLFTLCELPPQAATCSANVPQPLLDVLASFQGPALVLAPTTDVLACNGFAEALYDFDAFPRSVRAQHSRPWAARSGPPAHVHKFRGNPSEHGRVLPGRLRPPRR